MILACFFRGGKGGVSSKDAHDDSDAGDGKNLPIVDCLFPGVGNKFLGTNGDSTDGPDANDSEEATLLIGTSAKHSSDAGFFIPNLLMLRI